MNILLSVGVFLGCTIVFTCAEDKKNPEPNKFTTIEDPITAGRRTGTIRHELKVTFENYGILAQKMVDVLFRWMPILEQPTFNRTAMTIRVFSIAAAGPKNVNFVQYDMMFTEAANGLPKLKDKLAILQLEKSLKQHPIKGVDNASVKRSNILDLLMGAGLPDLGGVLPF